MHKKVMVVLFLILLIFPIVLSIEEQDCGKECDQHSDYGKRDQEKSGEPSESDIQAVCAQETNWPPSCSLIPDEKGRDLCIKCKGLAKEEDGGTFAYGEVQNICAQEWPANCSSIPDERKRESCRRCNERGAGENRTFLDEEDIVENLEAEDETSEVDKMEKGFFARIVRFFRELFE